MQKVDQLDFNAAVNLYTCKELTLCILLVGELFMHLGVFW